MTLVVRVKIGVEEQVFLNMTKETAVKLFEQKQANPSILE